MKNIKNLNKIVNPNMIIGILLTICCFLFGICVFFTKETYSMVKYTYVKLKQQNEIQTKQIVFNDKEIGILKVKTINLEKNMKRK